MVSHPPSVNSLFSLSEFEYPYDWLADQTVASRVAQRGERARGLLDPPPLERGGSRSRNEVAEPIVAFGPMGTRWMRESVCNPISVMFLSYVSYVYLPLFNAAESSTSQQSSLPSCQALRLHL